MRSALTRAATRVLQHECDDATMPLRYALRRDAIFGVATH